ncbi:serine/threonine-protein kinase [Jidongwangia harbinensis]|uniref:serine/threonine-protein kinase n=1 Tax=Jidongwangia harbinensis TaxID=2878561 RepID=UPI001CD97999|nr:serine/threonine-protein kinase [Jidongwangia harbinensis]MCA2215941.1 serine/threonine protein kinase [Jidongwangia harbinensis]
MDKDPTSSGVRADADGASTLDLSGRCVGSSYILIRPIGQGATGTVWRGVDRASGEQVAVKLLHESLLQQPKLVTRFVQERTILLMLRHRNVVRVRDLFSVGESLGLVMDLVTGGSLREYLRQHHTLSPAEAARLAAQVAAALAEAHDLGVVHRDLKPDNILLQITDGRLDSRLTDFGIARMLNTPALTTPNGVVGTPHYMSPEAFHGAAANPAADVYALGVLLYEMVSGRPPYDSDTVADLMRRHFEGGPERRPGIPDALWEVITSCLAQKPRLRPAAAELVVELETVARETAEVPALPRPAAVSPAVVSPAVVSPVAGSPVAPPPVAVPPAVVSPAEHAAPVARAAGRSHPSLMVPGPRRPYPRNRAPSWRWARPSGIFVVLAGTMLASGVATAAWHLGRSGDGPRQVAAAVAATVTPAPTTVAPSPRSASAPARSRARTGGAASRADRAADPSPRTSSARPVRRSAGPGTATPSRRVPVPEARPYGPQECRRSLKFDFDDPVLVRACHAVGTGVQMSAELTASAGARATVRISVQEGGRTVGGPHTCRLSFTEGNQTGSCGPRTVSVRRGHRYAVVVSWEYARNGRTSAGQASGASFTF